MDIKKLKLAIEQAQKVCSEMNQCANKFILQDSINDMNEALTIPDVVGRSEQLADHKCKPMVNADWTYLRCECGKRFEPKG